MPRKVRPSGRGTSTMSRGIDAMETVFPTGSSDATIIVSVSAVLRPTPESIPISSTFTRGIDGVGDGDAEAGADGSSESDGLASRPKSGSSDATGGTDASGTHAPPSFTGAKTSAAESRASSVRPATQSCGNRTMATATAPATMVCAVARIGVICRTAASAPRRHATRRVCSPSRTPSTTGSNSRAASDVMFPKRTRTTPTASTISTGSARIRAPVRRPATRWPRPGMTALSKRSRAAGGVGRWALSVGGIAARIGPAMRFVQTLPVGPHRAAPRCVRIAPCQAGFLQVPNLLPRPRLRSPRSGVASGCPRRTR